MQDTAETKLREEIESLRQARKNKQAELDEIENELDKREQALSILTGVLHTSTGKRFSKSKERPIEAIRILLSEAGGSMEQEELTKTLIREGAFDGKSLPEKRALLCYETNIKFGNLKRDGKRIILLRGSRTRPSK